MKTRLLIIVGISVAIALSVLSYAIYDSSTTVFIECIPPHEQVDGRCMRPTFNLLLDDPIHPNDPLIVSVEKTGYYMCDGWNARILDTANNSTIWEKEHHTSCVVASPLKQQNFVYKISNEVNPILINDVGRYLFQIDIGGKILKEEFLVLNTFGGISIDRTVYPEPEPEPMSESEILQKQKQQQAKLRTQEIIMTDYRGHQHQIDAINEYRAEFESGYFLEQFILFPNKQNYEKDDLISFIFAEWGYQPQKCTYPKVEVYLRPYDNYDKIEKIGEWQKPDDVCFSIDSDSDGYLIMTRWSMPGIFEPYQICTIPGEYRVVASNIQDESKKEIGYYTCQKEKLVGLPQPWMELPE